MIINQHVFGGSAPPEIITITTTTFTAATVNTGIIGYTANFMTWDGVFPPSYYVAELVMIDDGIGDPYMSLTIQANDGVSSVPFNLVVSMEYSDHAAVPFTLYAVDATNTGSPPQRTWVWPAEPQAMWQDGSSYTVTLKGEGA